MKKKPVVCIPKCLHCGVEIDDDVFPHYCLDCLQVLTTTGMLPNGLQRQSQFNNGDDE